MSKANKTQKDYMPYALGDGTYDIKDDTGEVVRCIQKINRNAPCTCGSGKKFKHCCGK